jgi:phage terminase small subunit
MPQKKYLKKPKKVKEPEEKVLTWQQKLFVHEYYKNDGDITKAAIAAKYEPTMAGRILKLPQVKDFMLEVENDVGAKLGITREKIALELARIAFFDIRKLFDEQGNLLPVNELDDNTAAAIAGIDCESIGKDGVDNNGQLNPLLLLKHKFRISSKLDAIDSLNKMLGYNEPDKTTLYDPDGNPLKMMPKINVNIINTGTPIKTDLEGPDNIEELQQLSISEDNGESE